MFPGPLLLRATFDPRGLGHAPQSRVEESRGRDYVGAAFYSAVLSESVNTQCREKVNLRAHFYS